MSLGPARKVLWVQCLSLFILMEFVVPGPLSGNDNDPKNASPLTGRHIPIEPLGKAHDGGDFVIPPFLANGDLQSTNQHGGHTGKETRLNVIRNLVQENQTTETVTAVEERAAQFLEEINIEALEAYSNLSFINWDYLTNITEHNKQLMLDAKYASGEYTKTRWQKFQEWKDLWPKFTNESLKRQFKLYSVIGVSALPKEKYDNLVDINAQMVETYSTGKICDYKNSSKCDLALDPEIKQILKTSQDYEELVHAWKAWRDVTGKPSRSLYTESIKLSNEGAVMNGFASTAEMWTNPYESDTLEEEVFALYDQLKPLYSQLHAYTRRKLREIYGESRIPKRGAIPAHVTGDMWAQKWDNIYNVLVPYPNKTFVDVTDAMKEQGYTPRIMFEKADDFFASMGLERVPEAFWNYSMIEKPTDGRDVQCHATAWDFSNGKDFRIKQCTKIQMEDFLTVHHELGHIQYFLLYKHFPAVFRRGANPGFHEAVGDVLSLSVSTPKHLHKIGLLDTYEEDAEADINFLLKTALSKVTILPYGYLVDKYRWGIMRNEISPENYTKVWWNYRYDFQGVSPPIVRTEEDFDPAAKFHFSGHYSFLRYFVATILQFQFYKSGCLAAKEYAKDDPTKPLHRCDIYQSLEAGKVFRQGLELGTSVHWKKVLKIMTGSEVMDASAMREYFAPLEKWLTEDNLKHGEHIGWEGGYEELVQLTTALRDASSTEAEKDPGVPANKTEENDPGVPAKRTDLTEEKSVTFMREINTNSSLKNNALTKISWEFQTNITDHNKEKLLNYTNEYGEYSKERWSKVQEWKEVWPTFANESLKRQFKLWSILGTAALPKEKLDRYNEVKLEMATTYSTGKICDFKNATKCDLSLEPEIQNIMKTSRDPAELEHVWLSWRNAAGKPVKKLYSEFAELANEAALLNGFPSAAEMWMDSYESESFEADVERLYEQLKPLYQQLHAYTRRKLREVYGETLITKKGAIPAHVTGNMWAQSWNNIYDLLIPYPNKTALDVTDTMVKKGYTPRLMYEQADDFFASLGLERVPSSFWNNSMLERPEDGREVVCHASAWDFADGKDVRIKQCTRVTMEDFFTAHHELGHVQYYMQYKGLPYVFREGANPGFHEALGDVLSLSVSTPKHLKKVGLLDTYETDKEADLNFLLQSSLQKIAFLPFGYLIDKYRWDLFRGEIVPENYTSSWWNYRTKYQGIKSPIPRTEEDFDPAAKFHVSSNYKYIRYFVAHILQFQFHKALCLLANEYDPNDPLKPLHQCDIYQSAEAGKALRDMMQLGKSKHWSIPLKAITGSEVIDASALREYFLPLEKWLIEDNEKHGEFIGWED